MLLPPVHREKNPFFHRFMTAADHDSVTFFLSLPYCFHWSTVLLNIYSYISNSPSCQFIFILFWMPPSPSFLTKTSSKAMSHPTLIFFRFCQVFFWAVGILLRKPNDVEDYTMMRFFSPFFLSLSTTNCAFYLHLTSISPGRKANPLQRHIQSGNIVLYIYFKTGRIASGSFFFHQL